MQWEIQDMNYDCGNISFSPATVNKKLGNNLALASIL